MRTRSQTPFPTTSLYFRRSPAAGSLGFRVRAWRCVRGGGGGGCGGEGHGLRAWTFRGRRPTGVAPPFGRSWSAKCECGRGRGPGGRTLAAGRVRPGWTPPPRRPWREPAGSAGRRERADPSAVSLACVGRQGLLASFSGVRLCKPSNPG